MRETITLQVGQCGNQIGKEFWEKISHEHGITPTGSTFTDLTTDRKDAFFYETESNKFVPRSILIDLEPRVINSFATKFYNPENIFIDSSGGGAGNIWAHGYMKGKESSNNILELIQREVEGSDNFESFLMMHSIAGGTGSGFGSYLLEDLRDQYPKNIIQSFSVFPNNAENSDVVVQPYNSILTMQRLSLCCDCVVVIDNNALTRINSNKTSFNNFSMINDLISTVISSSTSSIRFPSYMLSDLRSINSVLIPVDRLKFIVPSYTPFINSGIKRKTDSLDILRKLLLNKNRLAVIEDSRIDKTISVVNILSGMKSNDVQKGMVNVLDKGLINFVEWMPASYHCVRTPLEKRSGLCLSNGNNIVSLLKKVAEQFDKLKGRNAFVDQYRKFDMELADFDTCREVTQNLIDAYQNI